MNKHAQNRAVILHHEGMSTNTGERITNRAIITEQDYVAVPPPINLMAHPVGNCLIWLWALNADGYGRALFGSGEQLAHRQAFLQSRHSKAKQNVLHLCDRPFCIQPSHIYDGTHKENSDDRHLRISNELNMNLFVEKSNIVENIAKYCWGSPVRAGNKTLIDVSPQHDCEFSVSAGIRHVCRTCGRDELSDDADTYVTGEYQIESNDLNVAKVSQSSRVFSNIGSDFVGELSSVTDYTLPINRAERRRREKSARKSPFRNRPIILEQRIVNIRDGERIQGTINMKNLPITETGYIVHFIHKIP